MGADCCGGHGHGPEAMAAAPGPGRGSRVPLILLLLAIAAVVVLAALTASGSQVDRLLDTVGSTLSTVTTAGGTRLGGAPPMPHDEAEGGRGGVRPGAAPAPAPPVGGAPGMKSSDDDPDAVVVESGSGTTGLK